MPEQLLTVLKICLLVLLYLFFLRVLRAVWSEVNPPKVATAETGATGRRGGKQRAPKSKAPKIRRGSSVPTRLVLVEPAARAGAEFPLGQELTVGRAGGCSIAMARCWLITGQAWRFSWTRSNSPLTRSSAESSSLPSAM